MVFSSLSMRTSYFFNCWRSRYTRLLFLFSIIYRRVFCSCRFSYLTAISYICCYGCRIFMQTLEWSSMSGSTSLKSCMLRPWRRRSIFEISVLISLASFLVTAYSFAIWGGLQCLLLMGWQDEDCDSWSGWMTAFESFGGDLEVSVRRLTTCFRWVGIASVRL